MATLNNGAVAVPAVRLLSCILREEKVDEVIKAIYEIYPIGGVTVSAVRAFDPRSKVMTQYRGVVYPQTVTWRVRMDAIVPSDQVDAIVRAIRDAAHTGEPGDGKIVVTDAYHLERIRTGEIGLSAV